MSVKETLKKAGPCTGGVIIYDAAKKAAQVANPALLKKRKPLDADVQCRMAKLFPKLNLRKVRIIEKANLPPNWFTSVDRVDGMVFGYNIYLKKSFKKSSVKSVRLLMHELTHVDQVRRQGNSETKFACEYGKGYVQAGNYDDNPMELEAKRIQFGTIPDPCVFNIEFYRWEPEAERWKMQLEYGEENFRKTWDMILRGQFSKGGKWPDICCYDRNAGVATFYRINPDAKHFLRIIYSATDFSKDWDIIVPGQFSKKGEWTDLFFYSRSRGVGAFHRVDPTGKHVLREIYSATDFSKDWDIIVPGQFSKKKEWTDLFFYSRSRGVGAFHRVDPTGKHFLPEIYSATDFSKDWDIIVPGQFSKKKEWTDLFFYSRSRGVGAFHRVDPTGKHVLREIHSATTFRKNWDIIARANFFIPAYTDLIFYTRS